MKVHGQHWRYRIGNHLVCVDNAFAWVGWGQERIVANGGTLQQTDGWFKTKRKFQEPWLTPIGDADLSIDLHVTAMGGVGCKAAIAGEPVEPEALLEASWQGRGKWPQEQEWVETEEFSIFPKLGGRAD